MEGFEITHNPRSRESGRRIPSLSLAPCVLFVRLSPTGDGPAASPSPGQPSPPFLRYGIPAFTLFAPWCSLSRPHESLMPSFIIMLLYTVYVDGTVPTAHTIGMPKISQPRTRIPRRNGNELRVRAPILRARSPALWLTPSHPSSMIHDAGALGILSRHAGNNM